MDADLARALVLYEDHEDYDYYEEILDEMVDKDRWNITYHTIYRDTRDNTFWEISFTRGATEYQDEGPENISFCQVERVEVTKYEYKPISKSVEVN